MLFTRKELSNLIWVWNSPVPACYPGDDVVDIISRDMYPPAHLHTAQMEKLKKLSHLPVIVDPSHAVGIAEFVAPLALSAIAAGADGLLIEVHNNPACARCDGMQSLTPENFAAVMKKIGKLKAALLED